MRRVDTAVVGGGIAGLYAAWRLSEAPPEPGAQPPSVAVFEQHPRLGGRIDTVPVGNSTSSVEMGAMRFWKSQQVLAALLEQLAIPTEIFPGEQQLSAHLRGELLRPEHFAQPANVPFRLQGAEVGKDAGALLGYALLRLVPELGGALSPSELDDIADREDLRVIGFWNALESVLSSEAYQLLQSGMGERSAFSNWHAGEAIRLMAFIAQSSKSPLYRPVHGFSSLVDALADQLGSRGTPVTTGRRLLTIEPAVASDAGSVVLTFEVQGSSVPEQCLARRVILALPKHALTDLLHRSHSTLSGAAQRAESLLRSVEVFSAFKLYASYARPWWTESWGDYGFAVTDMPIRQVYYGVGLGGSDVDNKRVLMAVYADALPALFWGPLFQESEARYGASNPAAPVVQRAGDQIAELHGLRDLPEPEWWSGRDWGAEGGAWHAWKAGVSVPAVMKQVRRPFPAMPVFVCGEAFSRMQGWIEGALMTTEMTLEGPPFNLARPAWIPADYDLGP